LEFNLPEDAQKKTELVNYLIARRFKVMHMDIHSVTVCKEYTDYGSANTGGDDGRCSAIETPGSTGT
jgi:hypothetical protein